MDDNEWEEFQRKKDEEDRIRKEFFKRLDDIDFMVPEGYTMEVKLVRIEEPPDFTDRKTFDSYCPVFGPNMCVSADTYDHLYLSQEIVPREHRHDPKRPVIMRGQRSHVISRCHQGGESACANRYIHAVIDRYLRMIKFDCPSAIDASEERERLIRRLEKNYYTTYHVDKFYRDYVYVNGKPVHYWKVEEPKAGVPKVQVENLAPTKEVKPKGPRRTALYRHWDEENNLLYVGISYNPFQRTGQHAAEKEWFDSVANITTEWYPNREDAELAEVAAIKAEHPKHNVTHNS